MKTEFETRFLEIDKEKLIAKLKNSEHLMVGRPDWMKKYFMTRNWTG
ncbi:MAG: hypothetical protein WC657_01200 [Candidatus Paceibacterota bacterium]